MTPLSYTTSPSQPLLSGQHAHRLHRDLIRWRGRLMQLYHHEQWNHHRSAHQLQFRPRGSGQLSQGVEPLPELRRKDSKVLRLGAIIVRLQVQSFMAANVLVFCQSGNGRNSVLPMPSLPNCLSASMDFRPSVFLAKQRYRMSLIACLPSNEAFFTRDWMP